MLKHCAANGKRRLLALPNVGPYICDVKISGFTRSSIYDISRLRVKGVTVGLLVCGADNSEQNLVCMPGTLISIHRMNN
jgi:hypothetical protein